MLLKPAILVIVHFLQGCIVHGQTICKRHSTSEWKTQPTVHIVKWSLTQTICFHTYSDCWNTDSDFKRDTVEMIIPTNLQLCPLQLQLGDSLFVSSEPSFQSYGMNLANVSFEEFMRCPQNLPQKQLIFGCRLRGMHQIDPKWLGIGTHYFVETPARGQSLCNLGLRLNITVKQHLCQKSPSAPFCSGRGKCLSHLWDEAYHCFCNQPYTGQFCQHTDLCFSKPCYNNASCISRGEKEENGRDSYECVCPPLFAGRNCSEIIGQCQPHSCHHGNCSNVTPNTHQCQCNKNFSGPFCKEHLAPCNFHPCQNKGLCHNHPSGYRCNCPAGFQGHDCEVDINECSSRPCQNGGTCTDMPNDVVCTCLPMFTGKFCEKIVTICEPSPCLNNGTCIVGVESYHCSCMPGYTGKNCAEVIDYCGLLSINCLNEGLCLSIIEGFRCLCAPGWIGEFCQFIENACLMYSDHCHNGATCVDISPSNLQPQIECLCPQGFTGVYCETEINECDSHPCKHGGSCYDYKGHFKCNCPMGYEGQQCEADIDACLFHNISCSHGAHCIDQPYGLAYICGTACQENTELCANGGRCFHDEDNQGYHCVCLPGWTGPTCLENINDCEVSWCQNGGTCEDGINKYRCLCPPGYSGNFCELIFDPCTGNQCSDYGFCMGNLSDYTCHCNLGYEGPFCEVEANECLSSPCKNGATCLDLIGHFSCQCAAGFKGETCITRVEQCLDKPCRNGATCEEVVNGYKCNCPSGFSGQFCEREANKCDSMPCLNGAVCVDDVNGYDCFCPEGFEGLNCEINFDDCSYSFCKNNSTCLDLVADYACVCPPGFTDKNCSVDIDACAFNLCKNGASCHNLIGKFYCNCLPGFTGRLCETNVGNCLSQPCGSLSLCEDESDGYRCFCAPGFIGDNCETEVDECLSDPCQNGASCVDQLNAFSCLCPDGFQGMLCDINIYECHSNPCLHNATCTDLIGGYNCVCLPGFTGVHCETDIDECASFPCKNGGTCIDQPGNYSCQCVAPFKGFNCEFRPCEGGNPCENGAVCLKEMDLAAFPLGFRCQCVKGFAGPRCEINIDECSSSPCLHGYCYDVVDGFYCLCNPGYAGQKCDQDIDDCIINACKHNSTCVDLHLGYRCSCLSGWEGTFCESESNECDSVPCKNNGTCIDLFNNYRCLCATGWTGQQCGEDINECDPDPCLNGATCYESTTYGQFLCVCAPFYIGRTCQHHYNPCDVPYNPCVNNSTCLAQVDGKPLCICQKGFEGTYCEIDINECISSPCKNQGHCVDRVNSFRCFCRDGFSGTLCEVEINECISNPCANSGTCIDLINRFTCNCAPGYYGSLCELDVNECETLPCLHGGSCFNKPGGYQCACSPGFTGNQCETDIDECLSAPCRNNGSCVDGVNYYKCQCRSGYIGTNCETNVDECSSTPCLHGRCVDHVNGYQCICEAGWISSRCEINANECESAPCLNGGSCQDLVNAFECICLNGYTGEFCEVDIDICAEPLLNSSHCFNDGKCVDGPGRTFHCSCPNGFSGPFCEININECGSSPCLHDSVCEDLINGYVCKCQEGWEGIHCEEDINECTPNPCIHGICIQNEPGLGYTCYCQPGFVGRSCELNYNDCLIQACPVGFLCADGINNITCLPVVPGRDQVITQLEGVPPTEPLPGGLTPAWPSLSTSNVYILQTSTESLEKTDFLSHGNLASSSMATLLSNISFQGFGLASLTPDSKSSGAVLLKSSAEILTPPLLELAGPVATRIKSDMTPAPWMKMNTSVDVTPVFLSQEEDDMTSFITSSAPLVLGFSVGNHQNLAVSAIEKTLVISSLPGANTELNSYSLASPRIWSTGTAASIVSIASRFPLEDGRDQSAVFLLSVSKDWILPNLSASPVFLSKTIFLANVVSLRSSVIPETKRETSVALGCLDSSVTSFSQKFTDHKLKSASYLRKLNEMHPTRYITDMELLTEFPDPVLHSKDSTFYDAFWINSVLSTRWHTLMRSTTVTSRHCERTSSTEFTELFSSYPIGRSREKLFTEDYVLTRSLQDPNTESCFYTNCVTTAPLQTIPLEPSFSTITASQKADIYVITKLTDMEQMTATHILRLLDYSPLDPIKEIHQMKTQDRAFHPSGTFQEQNDTHISSHSEESTSRVKVSSERFLDLHLEHRGISQTDSVADFLDRHLLSIFSVNPTSSSVLAGQPPPSEMHFAKTSLPQHLQFPGKYHLVSSAINLAGSESQKHLKWTHDTDEPEEDLTASVSILLSQAHMLSAVASTIIPYHLAFSDFSYVQYEGDSYMEFEGFQSLPQNNISLEFHTTGLQGVIFYIEQNPATIGQTFIQLSVKDGILQYQFACGSGGEVRNIHTNRQVNDGQKYKVHIRQDLVMCEAEVTILGVTTKASSSGKDWSTFRQQDTGPIFIGGLPYQYTTKQVTEPVYNFTGCIEVTEINNLGPFTLSNAVDKNNIDSCRFPETEERPTAIFGTVPDVPEILPSTLPLPTHPALLSVCQETLCHNGGSCHLIDLPDGAASFQCDCPLHFTGRFCEKDTTLFFPSFSENSYLELPSVTSLAGASFASGQELHRMMIYLTVKTTASKGTLLYVSDEDAGDHFLHLYLVEGRPTARLGCGSQDIVMVTANSSISKNALVPITFSYRLPFGSNGGCCMIEMTTNENSLMRQEVFLMHRLTEVTFGSIFLGNVPPHIKIHPGAGAISGFRGCIQEFQVNNKELFVIDEAMGGRNIENCNVPVCDYHPCRNGGTCTSDTENWFCECAALYSGKLCQFSNCEKNPCGNGATCFPKNNQDTVCLCPYGRTGILCHDVINITSPSFSGTDAFGYTSFLAYSTIPNISLYYKFHLKFRLANDNSSLQDNLIFFTGQKGQAKKLGILHSGNLSHELEDRSFYKLEKGPGLNGDDFLVLGLRNGSVVYSYNLGSGTATIISEPINRTLHVHMVSLGKSLQSGWLKVDDHQNKTVTSPGRLVGLNVFSQFYVGGYIEYIPELLPNGSNFKNGFQGCIFDIQVCTGRDPQCKALGIPEGHPNSGRNVGQCDESPCQLINCKNGGTCVESGSTVYCLCHAGWKGALCTETVSPCDPEHNPPHRCRQGATCIPLPDGYTCHCLLGTTGVYCEQALTISDASFNSNRSSWMAFESFNIRHKVHIQLQFQPLMPDGILFYTAQHLNPRSGDFLSISLVNGYAQLRYNLGDRTIILQTFQDIYFTGSTWHLIKAGRVGNEGYLDFNGINITQKASRGMTALDTHTDFYIGGVPSLNLVNSLAIENEPVGFTGCIREVLVNNRELKLTKRGAKGGSNVGDCDGTPCGYKVCKHHGKCKVENSDFSCLCPKNWIGKTCEQSLYCSHRKCLHGAVCIPNNSLFSYSCACKLGWSGRHCEKQISFFTAKFMGNSYIKYIDPNYKKRDLRFTRVSFNFTTNEMEGLILWLGKAEHEDNDFLAVGLANGTLKVVVNLGERISVPLIHHRKNLCCNTWYYVTITQNRTLIKVYLDEELVVFEDLDPQRKYIALNYGGTCYFGAFGLDGRENTVTSELFKQGLIGKIKDVVLFQDSRKIPLIKGEGYNVYSGDKD